MTLQAGRGVARGKRVILRWRPDPPPNPHIQRMPCLMNTSVRTVIFGAYFTGDRVSEPRFQAKGLGKCGAVVMHLAIMGGKSEGQAPIGSPHCTGLRMGRALPHCAEGCGTGVRQRFRADRTACPTNTPVRTVLLEGLGWRVFKWGGVGGKGFN